MDTGDSDFIGSTGLPGASGAFVGLAYDEINQILYANDGRRGNLYTLNVNTGATTLVGSNGAAEIDGLAWMDDCFVPIVLTLSEWGLVAMARILGIVGFMVMRRRKVTA